MCLFLINGSLFFSIISAKGDFIVYFGCSCLGSTGLLAPVSTRPLVYFCNFLIFTDYVHYSPVFSVRVSIFSYFTNL